ncbi:response regulator transcription factor [Arcobacter sp. KX21116]|uniref:response regulator transcription factor n=1 Tax=Arcobacter TaxID=28196 RepID=UPI0035D51EDD|eukprot:TRINITY_DN11620_c0_g1_i1.p1 TRINITY_DN11620_c0_g1~~TRINITY_DN11620_c0_g1_i1.p1  ORF type:complete len:225 (+),score=-40.55 TRINITY_DN11620_c0_g1_i1:168-842(+)
MKKVLLVEDDLVLQNLINEYLEEYNYLCSAFSNPIDALESFKKKPDDFTIAILDLGLPLMDGFDLFKKLKEIKNIPILISTARDDIGNKIYGFELGTDDYLSKPYEPRELILRVEAILKRYNKADFLKIHDLSIDLNSSSVFLSDVEIEFTKVEKEIFLLFVNNLNKIISREDIVKETSLNDDTKNRTIDTHISNIRFKIDDNSKEPKYIKSIWGIGYKFFYDN